MPTKVRDTSPERRRDSSRREARSKLDKPDSREHRKHSHGKSADKEKSSSKSSLPQNEPRRSSMSRPIENENDAPNLRALEANSHFPYPSYPSFSKAHSREAVVPRPTLDIFTPPATDLNVSKTKLASSRTTPIRNAPPSPPLTDQNVGRRTNSARKPAAVETILEDEKENSLDGKVKIRLQPKSQRPDSRLRSRSDLDMNDSPAQPPICEILSIPLPKVEQDPKLSKRSVSQPTSTESSGQITISTETRTEVSSNATSIAPEQPNIQRPGSKIPPAAVLNDPRIDVTSMPGAFPDRRHTPVETFVEHEQSFSTRSTPAQDLEAPPPPPPLVAPVLPKVDYLLLNGGLPQAVPRNLLLAGKPMAVQQVAMTPQHQPVMVKHIFEPFNKLLEDFDKVISKNGSLAVATGYRSVARRLLDRLEKVFARDISSEACQCCMCRKKSQRQEDYPGVSWGEILELVSGRRDLPSWPPFTFVASPVGLGISLETHVPMQKLDIDVPEEYRDHYIRQSRKTKQSVDKWLSRQTDSPSSPPAEVDDETLTFAILTHLDHEHRSDLTSLLGIMQGPIEAPQRVPTPELGCAPRPPPTPQPRTRPESIVVAGMAIQRLHRLGVPPRDPETALFMLNNPTLHDTLATLAAVSEDEWDILISGRFDGFLRSGADDFHDVPPSQGRYTPYIPGSKGPTPAHLNGNDYARQGSWPSRTTTPATMPPQFGAPVALDEETEIATLAEIERDIYTGMEALEDAFEALHFRAETVRRALRERSAGLAAAAQRRRGPAGVGIEVRMDTPAGMNRDRWETETDDGLGDWDGISEIVPDDSASNISSSRRRRPKRRHERRTPALVEEDEDDYAESEGSASPRKR